MKLTKRELVKVGVALSVAGVTGAAMLPAPPAAGSQSLDALAAPPLFVYNDWFPEALDRARSLIRVTTLPIEGDAGSLWYGKLRMLVEKGGRHIAGLTTHTDLLILETLARDAGLKVRERNPQGRLVSWVMS